MRHRVLERRTQFELPPSLASAERPSMPAIYATLAADHRCNDLIFDAVLKALEAQRSPVVLAERRDHLELRQARFAKFAKNLVVLRGGMSASERRAAEAALRVPDDQERLILATGRYLGEGFDDTHLDTLILTMPIAWRGTLAQYVGGSIVNTRARRKSLSTTMSMPPCRCWHAWPPSGGPAIGPWATSWNRNSVATVIVVRASLRPAAALRASAGACACAGVGRSARRFL
jgi:hypothetical protein